MAENSMRSIFPAEGLWLKGNIHSHTTDSDGVCTPEKIAAAYWEKGYDFFAMTDHNIFLRHDHISSPLLLTGVEHDLAYLPTKCIHVVGIGSNAEQFQTGYLCKKYAPDELTDQQLIHMMADDGQFVVLAHPLWSRMEPEEVAPLRGFHAIEVYNNGCEQLCHAGHAEVYWDMLLRRGQRVLAVATDDTHKREDMFGGWIQVKAAKCSYESILCALFAGAFYASSGPDICDLATDGEQIRISCSPCREIHFISYPPRGKSFFVQDGEVLTEATYTRKGGEQYIRVECIDHTGHVAWSNPIYFD